MSLHLKYATLFGAVLTLYEDIPLQEDQQTQTPRGEEKEEYIIKRKYCLCEEDQDRMQFVIQVQDCAKKYRYKKLMLSVPKAVNKN